MTSATISKSEHPLTTSEVARLCDVSPMTVNRWVKSGQLPTLVPYNPYRKRQRLLFRRTDVERLAQRAS